MKADAIQNPNTAMFEAVLLRDDGSVDTMPQATKSFIVKEDALRHAHELLEDR